MSSGIWPETELFITYEFPRIARFTLQREIFDPQDEKTRSKVSEGNPDLSAGDPVADIKIQVRADFRV